MKINIHAGHNAKGRVACGAVGLIDESEEAREVVRWTKYYLKLMGCTVYDCTVNNAKNERENLYQIVQKCNAHDVDLDISVHFNAGAKDKKGDGKSAGFEVWATENRGIKTIVGNRLRIRMSEIGFRDRGLKTTSNFYVLNHTNAKAILLETCFVDDKEDVTIYKKNIEQIGKAYAEAIMGENVGDEYRLKTTLNVRQKPTILSRTVTKIPKGATVYIVSINDNGWGIVRYKGELKYIRVKSKSKTYMIKMTKGA